MFCKETLMHTYAAAVVKCIVGSGVKWLHCFHIFSYEVSFLRVFFSFHCLLICLWLKYWHSLCLVKESRWPSFNRKIKILLYYMKGFLLSVLCWLQKLLAALTLVPTDLLYWNCPNLLLLWRYFDYFCSVLLVLCHLSLVLYKFDRFQSQRACLISVCIFHSWFVEWLCGCPGLPGWLNKWWNKKKTFLHKIRQNKGLYPHMPFVALAEPIFI